MFLPECWLQFHNNKLLVSKTTTVLEQERPNASVDTSNIPLVVHFTSGFGKRRARLWMINHSNRLDSTTVDDDGETYLLFRLRLRMHTLPVIFCNILWHLSWSLQYYKLHVINYGMRNKQAASRSKFIAMTRFCGSNICFKTNTTR